VLQSGKSVAREISGGQTQRYRIELSAGQFASVTVHQRGIDVIEKLFASDGKLIAQFDSEMRPQEDEEADFVAETTGTYRLDVEAKIKGATGRYELQLGKVRAGTDHDRALYESHQLDTKAHDLRVIGRYDEALPAATRALSIGEKELGPDHVYVARLLEELGDIYHARVAAGVSPQARALYERALSICEKEFGTDHPGTAEAMRALGAEYVGMGEYPKADELLSRALVIEEKTLGSEHPQVARTLYSLGLLNIRRGETQKGEASYQRSLAIMEKTLGTEDDLYPKLLNVMSQ
jgi:tetratricopeptide (TPR) repeat protein